MCACSSIYLRWQRELNYGVNLMPHMQKNKVLQKKNKVLPKDNNII